MHRQFDNRVAVVTGAASGVGRAVATALAAAGATVAMWDVSEPGLRETGESIARQGIVAAHSYVLDLQSRHDVRQAAQRVRVDLGSPSLLVNCAGILTFGSILDERDEDWDRVMAVNVGAPYLTMQAFLPDMIATGHGAVVNIGSSSSAEASIFNTSGGSPAYITSKAALRALSRKAAFDVAADGVRVNVVAPGTIDSPMHRNNRDLIASEVATIPMGRLALPEDMVSTTLFLLSDDAAYITGQTVHVNGGRIMAG